MKKIVFTLLSFLPLALLSQTQMPYLKTGIATAKLNSYLPEEQVQQKAAAISTGDTLHYFFNKHFYRNPTPGNGQFLTINSPYQGTINISHCGAIFLNSSAVTVTGLEGLVMRNPSSISQNVPIKLYLCNVNGINLPILPPIDSITTSVPNTPSAVWVGGNFNTPHVLNTKFAVLFRRGTSVNGDSLLLFLNNAKTLGSNFPVAEKFGEALGTMRFNGNFIINTNVFGAGTDYEFIVAPRVQFSFTAGLTVNTPTICNLTNGSFSVNASLAGACDNRQFNFNKFASYWQPFQNPPSPTDSIYNWTFTGASPGSSLIKNPSPLFNSVGNQNVFLTLKYWHSVNGGAGTITESDVVNANQAITVVAAPSVSLVPSLSKVCTDITGGQTVTLNGIPSGGVYSGINVFSNVFSPVTTGTYVVGYSYTDLSTSCSRSVNANIVVQNCTGIDKSITEKEISFYPNPTINGEITIENIEGAGRLEVYNLLGEKILSQSIQMPNTKINLSQKARGTYLIRVSDVSGKTRTLKVFYQN